MRKASDRFGSPFLTAADFPQMHKRQEVIIDKVVEEEVGIGDSREEKLILSFIGLQGEAWVKRLIVNATNGKCLGTGLCDDPAGWKGRHIQIWTEPTGFNGKPGIRVAPANGAAPDLDDEIPWR
jgi:hypothetical protein